MYLVMLLAIPVLIGVGSLFASKGRITVKEFCALEVACLLMVGVGFLIARYASTHDTEIWSGRVVKKEKEWVSCEHSYSCFCTTDKDGNQTCQTCYEHSNDWDWAVYTSNGERIEINRIDRRGSDEPPRWRAVYIGETTAVAHSYKNYIKANPDSILRRGGGAAERFKGLIPVYPNSVYDYYRVNRFVPVGFAALDAREWNWLLNEVNADLGAKKQVNIVIVVTKISDPAYQYALEEAWLGGKKNDLIVLIGSVAYPKIDWVRIVSWSHAENLKVQLRDAIEDIGMLNRRDEIMRVVRTMTEEKFVRRRMRDMKYLMAGAQPGTTGTIVLFLVGVLTAGGLTWYFYVNDPFGDEFSRQRSRRWR